MLCMWAMCPLLDGLLETVSRCLVPMVAARLEMEGSSRPSVVVGDWIAFVGKAGVTPRDCWAAWLMILSMLAS